MSKKTKTRKTAARALNAVPSNTTLAEEKAKQDAFVQKQKTDAIVEARRDTRDTVILIESKSWDGHLIGVVNRCIAHNNRMLFSLEQALPPDVLAKLREIENPNRTVTSEPAK